MEQLNKWYAESPLASYLRVFVSIVFASAVTDFVALGHFDFANWEKWVIAGLVAIVAPASRVLNPKDKMSLG